MAVLTVYFANHGQDFLEFDIADAQIVASRPDGISSWRHFQVVMPEKEIKPGSQLLVQNRKRRSAPLLAIKYPISKIERHQVM